MYIQRHGRPVDVCSSVPLLLNQVPDASVLSVLVSCVGIAGAEMIIRQLADKLSEIPTT